MVNVSLTEFASFFRGGGGRHRAATLASAACLLMLFGCSPPGDGSRICERVQPAVAADEPPVMMIFDWDSIVFDRISIGALEFYKHEDFVREVRFDEDGSWVLRYEQGSMQPVSVEACGGPGSGYKPVVNIWVYRFAANEGEFGTVYHWYEKQEPDICDANGDGMIPEYVEAASPGWFREKNPRVFQCTSEAGFIDKMLSFWSLLSQI